MPSLGLFILTTGLAWQLGLAARVKRKRTSPVAQSEWLVTGPKESPEADGIATSMQSNSFGFFGTYRDLSLWRNRLNTGPSQSPLWVVELSSAEAMRRKQASMLAAGLKVLHTKGTSMVVEGEFPESYDTESSPGVTFVPVPSFEVKQQAKDHALRDIVLKQAASLNPKVVELANLVSRSSLETTLTRLADWDRNSYRGVGGPLHQAADWAASKFESYGFSVTRPELKRSGRTFVSQVVAELRGTTNPEQVLVVGAHLDSTANRDTSGAKAPGADDNGSGSAAVIEFARAVNQGAASFKNTLRLVLFTGEEQGLYGSMDLAQKWGSEDIIAMINMDMIGYKTASDPMKFTIMDRDSDNSMKDILNQTTRTYFSDKLTVTSTSACCSDHRSFKSAGVPSVGVAEPKLTPHYHKRTDLVVNMDMEMVQLVASATFASVVLFADAEVAPIGECPWHGCLFGCGGENCQWCERCQ